MVNSFVGFWGISAYSTSYYAQHTQIIGPCVANRCYVAKGY